MDGRNFEKFGRDKVKFMFRLLEGKYQVYASELQHICICNNSEMAELICNVLEKYHEENIE